MMSFFHGKSGRSSVCERRCRQIVVSLSSCAMLSIDAIDGQSCLTWSRSILSDALGIFDANANHKYQRRKLLCRC